jgi:hypothetical protein
MRAAQVSFDGPIAGNSVYLACDWSGRPSSPADEHTV